MNKLDIITTILGLAYIILEYKASIWMWVVGFLMQVLGIALYYQKGLYADCGMEFYYLAMTVYGFASWKLALLRANERKEAMGSGAEPIAMAEKKDAPPTHFPPRLALLWTALTLTIWLTIYLLLTSFTDSKVPIADSFTTALSIVGIWALARKYLEQWFIWIAVDVVTSALYFYKDIPFKASLYALYVVIAILGYRKWRRMMS
ncbi:MAG: nicotinamide mononucleotide transporter [Prevotella sp.]|nr:nicotinamide mononucleotide transporter [Prevotella sp.]